ncbi:MAG: acyltransferase, partial [Gammaproteobacteria bacterium]|nr:acyltransferase [Gammaproteobacteria bacterium]
MSITSIAPPFILMIIFIFLSHQLSKKVIFFKKLTDEKINNSSLHLPIEGLRGVLALSVFFCHSMVSFFFFKNGAWDVAPSAFYSFLGAFGVLLFFFITGYLFWIKYSYTHAKFKIISFYKSRLKRIMPAYIISLCIICLVVAVCTHFTLQVPISTLLGSISQWIALGVPFPNYPLINKYTDTGIIDAGVYWTLRFEMLFYLLLPIMIFFTKIIRLIPMLCFFGSIYYWGTHHPAKTPNTWISVLIDFSQYMTLGFAFGIIAAHLKYKIKKPPLFLCGQIGSLIIIISLLTQFLFIKDVHLDNYTYRQSLLLFIPFLLIVFNNSVFGLLTTRAMLLLGTISYSIYLLHGIALFVILRTINLFYPVATMNPYFFWSIIGIIGIIIIF